MPKKRRPNLRTASVQDLLEWVTEKTGAYRFMIYPPDKSSKGLWEVSAEGTMIASTGSTFDRAVRHLAARFK